MNSFDWTPITPNPHGDWISHRDDTFTTWPTIGIKKRTGDQVTVFRTFSAGLQTNRDAWVYSFSSHRLEANVQRLIDNYNNELVAFDAHCNAQGITKRTDKTVDAYLAAHPTAADPSYVKWSSSLKSWFARGQCLEFASAGLRRSTYRPFDSEHAYFAQGLNHRRGELASMFPTPHHTNIGFYAIGVGGTAPFSVLATDLLVDVQLLGAGQNGQYFPRWTYEKADATDGGFNFVDDEEVDEYGYRRVDNITDEILKVYRETVGPQVSKDDIFFYVYGQLHDPHYRISYAADLKKMLPHIPTPATREQFEAVTQVGRKLADLHIGYEEVDPYPLTVELRKGASAEDRETWRVSKMKWAKARDAETGNPVNDRTSIVYNPTVTISGIPAEAEDYLLGSRSALGWILDRWQVKTDKASGIVNDPNDWCDEVGNPQYIVDLIARVTTVAIKTNALVASLRELETE